MPCGFQEVEGPRFKDNLHTKEVRLSSLRIGHLYPHVLICVTGPKCGPKDYVNEKFQ